MAIANSFLTNYTQGNPGDLTGYKGLKNGLGQTFGNIASAQMGTNQQRGQEYGTLSGQFQGMANGSVQNDSDISKSILPELSGAYDQARQAGANHVARTHNASGYTSFLDSAARGEGSDYANTFAQQKLKSKMAGLQGLQSLYGIDTSFLNELGNQQVGLLGVGEKAAASKPSLLDQIGQGLGIARKAASGIAGGLSGTGIGG